MSCLAHLIHWRYRQSMAYRGPRLSVGARRRKEWRAFSFVHSTIRTSPQRWSALHSFPPAQRAECQAFDAKWLVPECTATRLELEPIEEQPQQLAADMRDILKLTSNHKIRAPMSLMSAIRKGDPQEAGPDRRPDGGGTRHQPLRLQKMGAANGSRAARRAHCLPRSRAGCLRVIERRDKRGATIAPVAASADWS
jgi:hypothetical protein